MKSLSWLALLLFGCGGAPFTFIDDAQKGDADVLPEVGSAADVFDVEAGRMDGPDGMRESEASAAPVDARGEDAPGDAQGSVDAGRSLDSSVLDGPVDHGEAAVDAVTPEAASEASIPDACTPPAAFTFGCGPPIYVNAPAQYCVLNQNANTAQSMQNQCACEYDCACLVASGARLCPGGESYQSCSIGTTGGVVVVCK